MRRERYPLFYAAHFVVFIFVLIILSPFSISGRRRRQEEEEEARGEREEGEEASQEGPGWEVLAEGGRQGVGQPARAEAVPRRRDRHQDGDGQDGGDVGHRQAEEGQQQDQRRSGRTDHAAAAAAAGRGFESRPTAAATATDTKA